MSEDGPTLKLEELEGRDSRVFLRTRDSCRFVAGLTGV